MRENVSFASGGMTCRGWLFRPDDPSTGARPAIVMSHGFSAVKEQRLEPFAERFAAEGFVVLVFDYRCLGASDGAPRGRIIPQLQHDDIRAALAFLAAQPGVDPERLGLWGTSYSGGHALFVGALDPRVKVIVAQVPAIDIPRSVLAMSGEDGFAGLLGLLADDHARRNGGDTGRTMPVTAQGGQPAFLAGDAAHAWFAETALGAPAWVNSVTLESVARGIEYIPAALIDLIAPRPLLIQAAAGDELIPFEQVRDAFARAGEPKTLEVHKGGHFDLYQGPAHAVALASQAAWFKRWL